MDKVEVILRFPLQRIQWAKECYYFERLGYKKGSVIYSVCSTCDLLPVCTLLEEENKKEVR